MKKAIAAGIVLAILFAGALWNIHYLDQLTGRLTDRLESSRSYCEAGNFDSARTELQAAIDEWVGADGYTHIFIRHSEINTATDAFYDLLAALGTEEIQPALGAYDKVAAQLESMAAMEHITLKSVF